MAEARSKDIKKYSSIIGAPLRSVGKASRSREAISNEASNDEARRRFNKYVTAHRNFTKDRNEVVNGAVNSLEKRLDANEIEEDIEDFLHAKSPQ